MPENILEYVVSDAFLQLWLTATADSEVRTSDTFHPALVGQFSDPKDIPDCIIVREPEIHTNSDNEFHYGDSKVPTVSFKEMILIWGKPHETSGDGDLYDLDRKVGPARVVLTGVKKWHDKGLIHRRRGDAVICKQATFTWAKRGKYVRGDGPYHVSVRDFQAGGNQGAVGNIRLGSLVPSWATVNARKLPQVMVRDVIKKNGLKVNLLAHESVFLDADDELIFLTEIAE